MPIDTQEKRRSTLGVWAITRILPVPEVGIDAAEREHLWLYSGITSGGAGPGPGGDETQNSRLRWIRSQ